MLVKTKSKNEKNGTQTLLYVKTFIVEDVLYSAVRFIIVHIPYVDSTPGF